MQKENRKMWMAVGVMAAALSLAPASWAGTTQGVRGEILAPAGAVRLATFNAWASCGVASATTKWAIGRELPCGYVPVVDACDASDAPQGALSYRFGVDPGTRGKPFTLTATTEPTDLEIVFRGQGVTRFDRRHFLEAGGSEERGSVPLHATVADVCIVVGPATSFDYVAG